MIRKMSMDWETSRVTFQLDGSEDIFGSCSFSGEKKKRMEQVEEIMYEAWLKAREIIPEENPSREFPASQWAPGTSEWNMAKRNGFGVPVRGLKPGQKVCCMEFTYEGFPDGRKCLISGALLKGTVLVEEKDGYIVRMAFSGTPYRRNIPFEHVLPLSDVEYEKAGTADMAR